MKFEFEDWIAKTTKSDGETEHHLALLDEDVEERNRLWQNILELVQEHYHSQNVIADLMADHGAEKTAIVLREKFPTKKRSRSGEMGELLATEIAERFYGWRVPVRRLRWKDGREMALRGDDLTAIWVSEKGKLWFLKGESKSRAGSVSSAIIDASEALDRDEGRPSRLSVLFVAERLREEKGDELLEKENAELAKQMEEAVLESFKSSTINHMLFTFSGSNPEKLLSKHFEEVPQSNPSRYIVGLRIKDHGEFIRRIYEAL